MHSVMLPITGFKIISNSHHNVADKLRSGGAYSLLSDVGVESPNLKRRSSNESFGSIQNVDDALESPIHSSSNGNTLPTGGKKRKKLLEDNARDAMASSTISHPNRSRKRGKLSSSNGGAQTLTSNVSDLIHTKETNKVKCRLKVDKKYIRLYKKDKDHTFKLTPFTMISGDTLDIDIIAIYNVQQTVLSSLSYNKTLLIRVNSSAAEELTTAVQENVISLVLQMFNKKRKQHNGSPSSHLEDDDLKPQPPGHIQGHLIRTNILQTSPHNVIYQKPSVLYGCLRGQELMFYKSKDMCAIADVVACRIDWREENVVVTPMKGNPLGIELLVNHEIREQFIVPTEQEQSEWLLRLKEVIEMSARRSQEDHSRNTQNNSRARSGQHSDSSDDEGEEVLSTIEPPAHNDDESCSSAVEMGSQRSLGSMVFNDGDTGSAPSTTKRSLSLGEEPDFFGDSVNSGDQHSGLQQRAGSSLFSADFWNDKKRQRSSSSTNAASLIENLQVSLQKKDEEVRKLKEQLARLQVVKLQQSAGSTQSGDQESENEEPDFFE
eukprot:CAMPEP_0117445856 /NCGR_PEP_ID=MMETSP0759-20121206/6022_1 /TAXON_ID=63605 /ORGANISM="Percolomonas cosmopolitus, Strain WS" /LENGTH=547 /DNA_ID=CAMNT_0005238067 /DNA_START=114 /DNA_END=1755 /DNA_ORIENTATION=+